MLQQVKIKAIYPESQMPQKLHHDDVGADLTVVKYKQLNEKVFLLDMGVSVEPPPGYYLELHSRSSIHKTNFMMANKVGIIDPGYRGVLYMPVRYLGNNDAEQEVKELVGKRFGQLILRKHEPFEIMAVDELGESQRGENGLGSTGN